MAVERDVAVIIATYKGERTIARAVASALAQPETAEVVVVNDASPDGVETAARGADDGTGRLKIVTLRVNVGPAGARNAGLAASTAPWIGVLDDDDYFEPGRLGRTLAFGPNNWDFIADDLIFVNANDLDGPRANMWFDGPDAAQVLTLTQFVAANLPERAGQGRELGFLKPIMRRAFLDAHGLRYGETLRLGEDYDLYARALAHGARFLLAPAQGYVAIRRAGSLSNTHGQEELKRLRDADTNLLTNFALPPPARAIIRRHRAHVEAKYRWQKLIDAVKAKSIGEIAASFAGPPEASLFLIQNLATQAARRWARR